MKTAEKSLTVLIIILLFVFIFTTAVKADMGGYIYLPLAFRGGPTAMPTPTLIPRGRIETGENQTKSFYKGESVYGWRIDLINGAVCDGGNCYLPLAPADGTVSSGVINPWEKEIQGLVPWIPTTPTATPTVTVTPSSTPFSTGTQGPTATVTVVTVEPTATATDTPTATATATETATPTKTPTPERRVTGDGGSLVFQAGEEVFGWKIMLLPSGRTCDRGNCWLPSAPEGGVVTSGVVNPWSSETVGITPWVPQY